MIDGRREKVANYRIEPPGLFRGRGAHPKAGSLKCRVPPEQVILNLDKDAPVPAPPAGHTWGGIVHDSTVTWLATWKENINNTVKYVFLAPNSSIKGQSDMNKFEKARTLKVSQILTFKWWLILQYRNALIRFVVNTQPICEAAPCKHASAPRPCT